MSVIGKLSASLGRRDEAPNQLLAKRIAEKGDKKAIRELVDNLSNKDKNIQGDCIKVLYEVGERKPALIADYGKEFVVLLGSTNNRLAWGAMTALDAITAVAPEALFSVIHRIVAIADGGSVITRDHGVSILTKLVSDKRYRDDAFKLLVQQLKSCPTNQLPMYAENAAPIVNEGNRKAFVDVLRSRLGDFEKETKRRRVETVIRKLAERPSR